MRDMKNYQPRIRSPLDRCSRLNSRSKFREVRRADIRRRSYREEFVCCRALETSSFDGAKHHPRKRKYLTLLPCFSRAVVFLSHLPSCFPASCHSPSYRCPPRARSSRPPRRIRDPVVHSQRCVRQNVELLRRASVSALDNVGSSVDFR